MDKALISRKATLRAPLAPLAGLLALGSAGLHFLVAPAHFGEWGGYGVFFLVVAALQIIYGLGLLVRDARLAASTRYLVTGILGSLLLMEVYAVSRTLGIPLLGPHAGHVEEIGALDVLSKALELGLVATLAVMLVRLPGFKPSFGTPAKLATAGFLGVSVALVLAGVFTREQREPFAIFTQSERQSLTGTPTQTLPTFDELSPLLVRGGNGPRRTAADVIYAPPIFFQAVGEELPQASLERPTLVFRLVEADHDHELGLTPEPPRALVNLDGGNSIEPYQVTVLLDGLAHRTSDYLFPMPEGMSQETLSQQEHTLTFAILLESEGESLFRWQLPLELPGDATSGTPPDVATRLQVSGLTKLLTRSQEDVQYGGRKEIRLEATYATPAYFAAAFPKDAASRYLPEKFTVFLLTERLHTADLPGSRPDVVLSLDGQTYKPDLAEEVTASPHHRTTLVRFPTEPPAGLRHRVMELALPGDAAMTWHLPVSYAGLESRSGLGVTWVWVLAVLGGLVAAMWPCLFQLTVFFIPALGGLSMQETSSSVSLRRRASVVKAALFFVLGFTVVYTVAGALIGFAAARLGDMSGFYTWQRYLGIAGGIVIVLLALRVAARVRAPLVCKMPLLSTVGRRSRPANPVEMMVSGVAFATGCMTCFGAAIVVAMVVYVGLSGSALVGAFTLFLFSMGMGIPLVIAAIAMSKVLPLLARFEKAVRWMGLASSLVMVGFAVLLITGNYMALTEWVYRAIPGGGLP